MRTNHYLQTVKHFLLVALTSTAFTQHAGFSAERGTMPETIEWPPEMAGWKWDGEKRAFEGTALYEYIDGAAEVYLSYDFREVTARRYVRSGQPDILVDLYRMKSSEDAFGVFSLEKQDPEAGIGQGSEFGGGLLRFWKGPYFVTVLGNGTGRELEEAVLRLGRELDGRIKETGPPPRLPKLLPGGDVLPPPDRLCYVHSHVLLNRCFFVSHQNILRLGPDVQAVLARYPLGATKLRLLLVRYPTANKAFSAYSNFMTVYLPDAEIPRPVQTEDGLWTRAEHYRDYVVIVFGGRRDSEAEQLVQILLKNIKENPL